MGSSLSEPCIYDKLSESIDILRQSGYRYGMSESEIEKFIKQVLETNEPRRDPPQFPILRATVKLVLALGVLLMVVLVFTYPHSAPLLDSSSAAGLNRSSPLSHARLLELPIANKYNLHGETPSDSIRHIRPHQTPLDTSDSIRHIRPHQTPLDTSDHRVQVWGWLVVAEGSPWVRVVPVQRCQTHCRSFSLWLEPGDMVLADPRFWLLELFPSGAQRVLCDGPVL
uniref:Zgc:162255 n=1 Tax=Cyprinus carpio TaxID=7962 RepID=A0A8C1TB02_CYPCA